MEIKTREAKGTTGTEAPIWRLGYVDAAAADAKRFLDSAQYDHVVSLFEQLAYESNPRLSTSQDVRKIENYYELRDKGGLLGQINFRAYFDVLDEEKLIVVLGCDKKEQEGKTPEFVKIRIRNRQRFVRDWISQHKPKGNK